MSINKQTYKKEGKREGNAIKMRINHISTLLGARRETISDLARVTGLSRVTVANLYHDNFEMIAGKTIIALCNYFQLPFHKIIEWQPDPKPLTIDQAGELKEPNTPND